MGLTSGITNIGGGGGVTISTELSDSATLMRTTAANRADLLQDFGSVRINHLSASGGGLDVRDNSDNKIFLAGGTVNFGAAVEINAYEIKPEGTNKFAGVATLVNGTVTVATNRFTNASTTRVLMSYQTKNATTLGILYISASVNGTSFTITSSGSVGDNSTVYWQLFESAE